MKLTKFSVMTTSVLFCASAFGATPTFDSFDTNYFSSNNFKISLKTNNLPSGGGLTPQAFTTNAVPFAYQTNETHTLPAMNTNAYFMSGAGDSGVNGFYQMKGTFGGITVWTNNNGQAGLARDLAGAVFVHAVSITNSAGSVRYDKDDDNPITSSGPWDVINGTAPAPTVVIATNSFSTVLTAWYPVPGIIPPLTSYGTNIYYVNPITGNDTNAIPGRPDFPYKSFTNVIWYFATHTNDIVALFPGTNRFGYQNIQVSNGVSIVGLGAGPDACWLDKASELVDVTDISLRPGIGSVFANFSGNISLSVFKANVTFIGLHTIGWADNLLPNTGSTNFVSKYNFYEVNGFDVSGLIDAAVINGGYGTYIGDVFSSRRRGNSPATRRGININSGTNTFTGCTFIATDSTNACYGVVNNGGYNVFSGCVGIAHNTNGLACAVTNANDSVVIPEGPFSMVFSNGVAKWISPLANPSLLIRSNTLASIPVLSKGDAYLWSSNSILYSINCSPSGVLTTNKLAP